MRFIILMNINKNTAQNYRVVRLLVEQLEKRGHYVNCVFPSYTIKEYKSNKKRKGVYTFFYYKPAEYSNHFLYSLSEFKNRPLKLITLLISKPLYSIKYLIDRTLQALGIRNIEELRYKRCLEAANRKINADIVVGISNPFSSAMTMAIATGSYKKIWYQIDPHSLNGIMKENELNYEIEREQFIYEQSDNVIVQPLAYKEIRTSPFFPYLEKCNSMQFPLIRPVKHKLSSSPFNFDKKYINCVFAGALTQRIRRPEYMLSLFNALSKYRIKLHIWSGDLQAAQRQQLASLLSNNVEFHGSLEYNSMISVLNEADILVNLGNSKSNQFPSKLLDYISIGKPILNIYKIDNCPTLDVIEQYPLGINVSEKEDIDDASKIVMDFIEEYKGRTIPYKEVESCFREFTPEQVADKFLNICTKVSAM
ncbi:glycosyltransferase [Neobacillus sp. LXY-4]|uniref:glycosyltransferase n=1 Tax=Neobacillus sp. LXY-4 TaxID=3379826 RepID=UPI003EE21D91